MLVPLCVLLCWMGTDPAVLSAQLETAQGSRRRDILLDLAEHYRVRNAQQALTFGREAMDLSASLDEPLGRARACLVLCDLYSDRGLYEQARMLAEEARNLARTHHDPRREADALHHLGVTAYLEGLQGAALTHFLEAVDLLKAAGAPEDLPKTYISTAGVYLHMRDENKAKSYLQEAYAGYAAAGNEEGMADALNNLAVVDLKNGDNDAALGHHLEALHIYRKTDNRAGMTISLATVGNLYRRMGRFDEAEATLTEALTLARQMQRPDRIALCYSHLGKLRENQDRLDEALEMHQQALDIRRGLGNSRQIAITLVRMAMIYGIKQDHAMQARYLMWALDEKADGDAEAENLEKQISLVEQERSMASLRRTKDAYRDASIQNRLTITQMSETMRRKDLAAQRYERYRNSLLAACGAVLLLSAFLLHLRANRRQLELERENKSKLEDLVSVRTAELVSRCDELETLEGIIQTINRETELPRVLQTMLDQALVLFPKADRGAFLLWSKARKHFEVVATTGYPENALAHVYFSHEEMLARYTAGDTLRPGVVLIDDFESLAGKDKLDGLDVPTSLVATEVRLENEIKGFFVLETYAADRFFERGDTLRLIRFREHVISALEKAHHLDELRRINQEILRAQDKLVMQQKMASLGILSTGIAHEMKNPLNFVTTLTELNRELGTDLRECMERFQAQPDAAQFQAMCEVLEDLLHNSRLINKHGKRANQIVQVMMEMARGGSVEKRQSKLNSLVNEFVMLAYTGMTAKESLVRVRLEMDLSEDVGYVEMAPQNISRVIINIINNAFESVVKKKLGADGDYHPSIRVSTHAFNDQAIIRIRDNGMGIAQRNRTHIWEHFFSTKSSGEGNIGLGLAISYDIVVNEHGGSIVVDSEEGDFAEFIISLPHHARVPKRGRRTA